MFPIWDFINTNTGFQSDEILDTDICWEQTGGGRSFCWPLEYNPAAPRAIIPLRLVVSDNQNNLLKPCEIEVKVLPQ